MKSLRVSLVAHRASASLMCLVLLLGGCATSGSHLRLSADSILISGGLKNYSASDDAAKRNDPATLLKLRKDFVETLKACNGVLVGLDDRANVWGLTSVGISMIGLISGSIIVPTLVSRGAETHKAAIAAFSGISGAANTSRKFFEQEGFTSKALRETREAMLKDFQTSIKAFGSAKDEPDMVKALNDLSASCLIYSIATPPSSEEPG